TYMTYIHGIHDIHKIHTYIHTYIHRFRKSQAKLAHLRRFVEPILHSSFLSLSLSLSPSLSLSVYWREREREKEGERESGGERYESIDNTRGEKGCLVERNSFEA